jgi:hypothetical protein
MARKNEDTVHWIRVQQERARRERVAFWSMGGEAGRWCDAVEGLLEEGIKWARRWRKSERSRRQREMDHAVQEELRRLQARRAETDRCRAAYERRKTMEDERERRRKKEMERTKQEAAEKAAWESYEATWNKLSSNEAQFELLSFEAIPWPLITPPRRTEDIRSARITMFVLSPHHSHGQTMKERVRSALRRWHPDRFGRILARVKEEDRAGVEEGVGIVVRCLNELLERA